MKTIVGLFDDMAQARQAAPELEAAGVRRGDISIAAANEGGVRVSVTVDDALAGRVSQILERGRAGVTAAAGEQVAIPIVEEELQVGKRQVESGGARVQTSVTETPVQEQVTLREEHATVERHPVNRPATEADLAAASREGTIEVTERAEVPVVSKEARVVEEVVVGKEATERVETVQGTVRRTDVDVEELNAGDASVTQTVRTTDTNSDTTSR